MKILLLAPHPFYRERGTPIAVRLLAQTLAEDGHTIDLLCYHEGDDTAIHPCVTIHRSPAPPGVRGIRPGFSLKKLLCDVWMVPTALRMARHGTYDIVHAVEEAAFMAIHIQRRTGLPFVFDMDSSMPLQIVEKLPWLRPLRSFMCALERRAIRRAAAVVPVCDYLAAIARHAGASRVTMLRDIPLGDAQPSEGPPHALALPALDRPVYLYVGNLEHYQGIDLMVDAFAVFCAGGGPGSLLVVGGTDTDVEAYRRKTDRLEITARVALVGPRPVGQLPQLLQHADILVSPRIKGGNTPMKVYSYLASGKPVLATAIDSHTQVMNSDVALLVDPTPEPFARAMRALADDREHARALGQAGAALAANAFSRKAYRRALHELYRALDQDTR